MPEVQEVFRMSTQKVRQDPGAMERQQTKQVRAARNKKVGAFVVVAAIAAAAIVLILSTRPVESTAPPANGAIVDPVDATAVKIATNFVVAYGSFDADKAISYLADGADVSVVGGAGGVGTTPEEWPLNLSWWEATGYKQMLDSCEETGSSDAGTMVRCTLDYHNFGSDRIGRGPFTGSSWDLTVRDGQIVSGDQYCEIAQFSPQMWEPFATWVSKTYPKDAAVMYADETLGDFVLTQRSIDLWEQHTKDYVKAVNQGTAA